MEKRLSEDIRGAALTSKLIAIACSIFLAMKAEGDQPLKD